MTEFHIGQQVIFTSDAEVTNAAANVGGGVVTGYDEVDEVDYVVVLVKGFNGVSFEQWVLPEEAQSLLDAKLGTQSYDATRPQGAGEVIAA